MAFERSKFKFLTLFICFLISCASRSDTAGIVLVEFLDSVKDFQNNPEKFYGFFNIANDDDMVARITGLKKEAGSDFILYPLFFNHMKYVIKSRAVVSDAVKFEVEIRNIKFKNGMEKFLNKLKESELELGNIKNLLIHERKILFEKVVNDVINDLSELDYISVLHTFNLIKTESGEYKIDLSGEELTVSDRNKLFDELFLKLSPGIFQNLSVGRNENS
ncbi:hypothetical protein LKV13_02300 [Borrelia sp. BU AG58]|uniref:hypothetical protein n=1 Tax=Borrelia sp. BU AG58 TaxID=2887345 RepID=UPI001E47EFB9|nr:hypothetical protein [Borrelia sp. BU AG58]UER67630.1 hypothetical protein LKV13_02300 [Borrelia sp. BU AG58]